jgi:hypothetical protein
LLICQMPKDCTIIPKPQSKGKTSKPRYSPLFATFESIRFILKGQDNASYMRVLKNNLRTFNNISKRSIFGR